MKYIKNYLFALAVAAMAVAACDKTKVPEYEPAPAEKGEQVFFPSSVADVFKIPDGETSFVIPVQRGTANLEAMDVPISASGDGVDFFTIPGEVSFASGAETANLTITITDVAVLGKNNFHDITLTIADESMTTPYGRSSITFSAGIEMPWIKFDNGTYHSFWMGEDYDRVMEYQQLSSTMRYCRIQDMFNDGGSQDLFFYWETTTNTCFVLPTILEPYDGENNCVTSDMASFYTKYQDWEGDVGKIGSDEWFAWAGPWMVKRDGAPYYDGNGTFHLNDWFYIASAGDGVPTGRGWMFGGDGDTFKGASFGDYTMSVSYDGMFVTPEGEAQPVFSFENTKKSAKYFEEVKFAITGQDADPAETVAAIAAGSFDGILSVTIENLKTTIQLPLEPGAYTIVAVPFVAGDKNDKGEPNEFKTIFAQAVDFYFPGLTSAPAEVEGDVILMDMEDLFGKETCEEYGYYNYNSIGWVIEGKDIKSGKRGLFKTSVFNSHSIEEILENCTDLKAEQVASINEKGYYANGFINLDPATSYTMVVELTNVQGATKVFTAERTTADMPYEGDLVVGQYTLKGSKSECVITVQPTDDPTEFYVIDLGIEDGGAWHATYDAENLTLTCDGVVRGYEQYGNLFGVGLYYYDPDKTYYYGTFVFDSDESEGNDPLVFRVKGDTKELVSIDQEVAVLMFLDADDSYVGAYSVFEAGSTVTFGGTSGAPRMAEPRKIVAETEANLNVMDQSRFAKAPVAVSHSIRSQKGNELKDVTITGDRF